LRKLFNLPSQVLNGSEKNADDKEIFSLKREENKQFMMRLAKILLVFINEKRPYIF